MPPTEPDFEFTLFPPRVRGKGFLPVLGAIAIAFAIVWKADLSGVKAVWQSIASDDNSRDIGPRVVGRK